MNAGGNKFPGLSPEEITRTEIEIYCSVLLADVLPGLLQQALGLQEGVSKSEALTDLTPLFYDYSIKGMQLFRIRMVSLLRNQGSNDFAFDQKGTISQLFIRVPLYTKAPSQEATDGDFALITVDVETKEQSIEATYNFLLTPSGLAEIKDLDLLTFELIESADGTVRSRPIVDQTASHDSDYSASLKDKEQELSLLKELFRVIEALSIGNQSRNDGTTS